jgi:hypothetical protein
MLKGATQREAATRPNRMGHLRRKRPHYFCALDRNVPNSLRFGPSRLSDFLKEAEGAILPKLKNGTVSAFAED